MQIYALGADRYLIFEVGRGGVGGEIWSVQYFPSTDKRSRYIFSGKAVHDIELVQRVFFLA